MASSKLDGRPSIPELTDHANVGVNWHQVGVQLGLDIRQLKAFEQSPKSVTSKMTEMYELWLATTPTATRRQLLEVLRKPVIGENTLAYEYEKWIVSEEARPVPTAGDAAVRMDRAGISTRNLTIRELVDVLQSLRDGGFPNRLWVDLGLQLGLSQRTLDDIESDKSNVRDRLRETLAKWLGRADDVDKKGGATWTALANALESSVVNQKAVADHIRARYML